MRQDKQKPLFQNDLPRVHKWRYGRLNELSDHNGKLIMRTDSVKMFFVHYITEVEKTVKQKKAVRLPLEEVTLLHYKESADSIFGESLPLIYRKEPLQCKVAKELHIGKNITVRQKKYRKIAHHGWNRNTLSTLECLYRIYKYQ